MAIYIFVIGGYENGDVQLELSTRPLEVTGSTNLACEEYIPSDSNEEPTLRILEALLSFPGDDASSVETQLVGLLTHAAKLYHKTILNNPSP